MFGAKFDVVVMKDAGSILKFKRFVFQLVGQGK